MTTINEQHEEDEFQPDLPPAPDKSEYEKYLENPNAMLVYRAGKGWGISYPMSKRNSTSKVGRSENSFVLIKPDPVFEYFWETAQNREEIFVHVKIHTGINSKTYEGTSYIPGRDHGGIALEGVKEVVKEEHHQSLDRVALLLRELGSLKVSVKSTFTIQGENRDKFKLVATASHLGDSESVRADTFDGFASELETLIESTKRMLEKPKKKSKSHKSFSSGLDKSELVEIALQLLIRVLR